LQLKVHAVFHGAALQELEDASQWLDRALKVDDLPRELIDASGQRVIVAVAEQLILDLVDVVLQARDNGLVLVDDLIEHGIQHASGPMASSSGLCSMRRRTAPRSADSAWRMVITKSGPTNTCSSPNSTDSSTSR